MMNKTLVFYHKECRDGTLSAVLFKRLANVEVEMHPIQYNEDYVSFEIFKQYFDKSSHSTAVKIVFVDFIPSNTLMTDIANLVLSKDAIGIAVCFDHHSKNILASDYWGVKKLNPDEKYSDSTALRDYRGHNATLIGDGFMTLGFFNHDGTRSGIGTLLLNKDRDILQQVFNDIDDGSNLLDAYNRITELDVESYRGMSVTEKVGLLKLEDEKEAAFLSLLLAVEDGDLFNFRSSDTEAIRLEFNKDFVAAGYCPEKLDKIIDEKYQTLESVNELAEKGDDALMDEIKTILKHMDPLTFIYVNDMDIPLFIAPRSCVSKMSSILTEEVSNVIIGTSVSSKNGKSMLRVRVGSSIAKAAEIAAHFGGGGHPGASGAELNMDMFSTSEKEKIYAALMKVES